MQDSFKKINTWFRGLTKKKISYEKKSINPSHDWAILLVSSITVVVCIIAFAFYFYLKINSGDFFNVSVDSKENEAKINRTLLDKTINNLKDREANLDAIKLVKTIPKDPSF